MRQELSDGILLLLGDTEYTIQKVVGMGGSSIVYEATYPDQLNRDKLHRVLIKELYPLDEKDRIHRDKDNALYWDEGAEEKMTYSKERFFVGNAVNLSLLEDVPEQVSGNINSYQAYNTYYLVLPVHGGQTLTERLEGREPLTLLEMVEITKKLGQALAVFHKRGYLYLDVSPDNILLLSERVLLIDYNSAWKQEDGQEDTIALSEKAGYSAPEVRMKSTGDIGQHTDLFSVCAVLYRMVTGHILSDYEMNGRFLLRSLQEPISVFEGVPHSAKGKTFSILLKGLHVLPRRRFQSVEELLKELDELTERIGKKGVSHSALWESSRELAQKRGRNEVYLPQDVRQDGKALTKEELYDRLCDGESTLLYGTGGMGKTRLLGELWKRGTAEYRSNSPVVYYVPLKAYQNEGRRTDYIRRYIVHHLSFSEREKGVEDALHAFDKWMEEGEGVRLILLLDGLNEAGVERVELLREIERLQQYETVCVLVTERTDEVQKYGLKSLKGAELLPLHRQQSADYLESLGLKLPPEEEMSALLTNPMLLMLYVQVLTMDSGREEEAVSLQTGEELVELYLTQLENKYLRDTTGNQMAQLQMQYIMRFLLPEIGKRMQEKIEGALHHKKRLREEAAEQSNLSPLLTGEELERVVDNNYRNLYRPEFGRSFPMYQGKSRLIFEGIRNGQEWFDLAVNEMLVGTLGLVVRQEDGGFGLIHDNYLSCLVCRAEENGKQYDFSTEQIEEKSERTGKSSLSQKLTPFTMLLVGFVGSAVVLGSVGMLRGGNLLRGNVSPSNGVVWTEEEEKLIERAYVCMEANIGAMNSLLKQQKVVIEMASKEETLEENEEALQELRKEIERTIERIDQNYNILPSQELLQSLFEMDSAFPLEELKTLCDRTEQLKELERHCLPILEERLCGEGKVRVGSMKNRRKLVETYSNYLDSLKNVLCWETHYILLCMAPEKVDDMLRDSGLKEVFGTYIRDQQISGQDKKNAAEKLELAKEDLEEKERDVRLYYHEIK